MHLPGKKCAEMQLIVKNHAEMQLTGKNGVEMLLLGIFRPTPYMDVPSRHGFREAFSRKSRS